MLQILKLSLIFLCVLSKIGCADTDTFGHSNSEIESIYENILENGPLRIFRKQKCL